jgi:arylesterase / paraoxonase
MDVVPSYTDPTQLFVYAVNHRPPLGGRSVKDVGADSSIEIYETVVGGSTMTHIRTVEDQVIATPNDVAGSPNGKSFYFTNDHGFKTGFVSHISVIALNIVSNFSH